MKNSTKQHWRMIGKLLNLSAQIVLIIVAVAFVVKDNYAMATYALVLLVLARVGEIGRKVEGL